MLKRITTPEKPSQKKSQVSPSPPGKSNSIQKLQFMEEQWDKSEAWGRKGEEGSTLKEIS